MQLVLALLTAPPLMDPQACRKTFNQTGGDIGRARDCAWVIPDPLRHLSSHHLTVSYKDGAYFFTDRSSNGTRVRGCKEGLARNKPVAVEHGCVYLLGRFEVLAELVDSRAAVSDQQPAGAHEQDLRLSGKATCALDPVMAFDQQVHAGSEVEDLLAPPPEPDTGRQHADPVRIDRENLVVPQLIAALPAPAVTPLHKTIAADDERLRKQFAQALGVDLKALDAQAADALLLSSARLLRHCIEGLQQSLHTRSELKNELRLDRTTAQDTQKNPLKSAADATEALSLLLQAHTPGQLTAEQAILRAFHDVQAHQVALLAASRAAVRSSLEHFSPQQIVMRFERDHRPLLTTAGRYWKAYGRYYRALSQDDDWSERLLAQDFARAYEEQVRLISTLHTDPHG